VAQRRSPAAFTCAAPAGVFEQTFTFFLMAFRLLPDGRGGIRTQSLYVS